MAGVYLASLAAARDVRAQGAAAAACSDPGNSILPSPLSPWKGAPLRVLFVSEKPMRGELSLIAPDGGVAAKSDRRFDGPPYSWYAEVNTPAAGTWRATLTTSECGTITRDIAVSATRPAPVHATGGSIWPIRASWTRATENLYAAWLEKLFDDPLDATPSWPALHEVLRDRKRNMLFDYLGLNEDQVKMVLRPDCADLPYFLRAYFAFKLGLPFGYSVCSRGGGGKPPQCFQWFSIQKADASKSGLVATFGQYTRTVADAVHSGTARTPDNADNTDQYPVALSQDTLRPGVIYADPYGHVLTIVRRVPEADGKAGIIFAVDGQPDGTVARKRYWRGNFLFAKDPALGGPGFKRFRPIVRDGRGALRRLTNKEIAANPQYGDFSLEQAKLGVEDFYDRMDDVLSPEPLDPVVAMKDAIDSLDEQVKVRVQSVENGRKFLNAGRGEASMPDGATIFETNGAWEDFSTPSRDLRLLIAIDVVRHFPDRVARGPQRYAMPAGKSVEDVKAELQNVLATELATRKFSYPRSDGSPWTLTLKDVIDRMSALEMAYNPNDCVELRWGAPAGSEEMSTCRRHAPAAQRAKMTKYRAWFHERRRPPRA
ncbi:MAG TPA: hypothetical protein VG986_22080 [Pseudolabrys sp.]|nr:hypothetical protein [Pseudolabrys sp.]